MKWCVSRIERSVVMPNVERLVELATVFGCETADLLTEGRLAPGGSGARRLPGAVVRMNSDDRALVLEFVERLVERLGGLGLPYFLLVEQRSRHRRSKPSRRNPLALSCHMRASGYAGTTAAEALRRSVWPCPRGRRAAPVVR